MFSISLCNQFLYFLIIRRGLKMLFSFSIGSINQFLFFSNVILWTVLIGAFVIVKVKNSVTRRKYSKKQENEVAQEYHSSGLH